MSIDTIDPETELPAVSAPEPRRSVTVTLPSRRVLARGAVIAVLLGLIATVAVDSVRIHDLSTSTSDHGGGSASLDAARASALTAATAYTTAFATYSYQHLAQDFGVTESRAVNPFRSQYRKETAGIQHDLVKLKSVSTGKVLSAGIVSVTPTTAVVDLFLDQTIVNSASSTPRVEPERVQMTLTREASGGPWQIAQVSLP